MITNGISHLPEVKAQGTKCVPKMTLKKEEPKVVKKEEPKPPVVKRLTRLQKLRLEAKKQAAGSAGEE